MAVRLETRGISLVKVLRTTPFAGLPFTREIIVPPGEVNPETDQVIERPEAVKPVVVETKGGPAIT